MRRKKFNFPLFIIIWISHRVTNLTHAVYFWWTVASIILPVFLHIQIVQAFVCQLSSLYRIAPSSSPQLSSFMSLFNGSRLQTYCPVACLSLWTQRTLWCRSADPFLWLSGSIHSDRSQHEPGWPSPNSVIRNRPYSQVCCLQGKHSHIFSAGQQPSSVQRPIKSLLQVQYKKVKNSQMKVWSKWAYGFSWTWPWIRRTDFFLFLYFFTLNMVTTKATFMKMNSTFFVVFVFKRIYTCFLNRFSIDIDSTVCEHCITVNWYSIIIAPHLFLTNDEMPTLSGQYQSICIENQPQFYIHMHYQLSYTLTTAFLLGHQSIKS